jgi:hypothetical protein
MESPGVRLFSSPKDPELLLHAIVDSSRAEPGRVDISPVSEWLQLSMITLAAGASLRPHAHVVRDLPSGITRPGQEAWIVLRGSIGIRLFDEAHALIAETTLEAGHLLVTFHGGHAFHAAGENTVLIECKLGPYEGRDYVGFDAPSP